jgi:hypothetical protein
MYSYLSDRPIMQATDLRRITLVPSSRAGFVTASRDDGTVISIAGNGSEESRPAGTDAEWEQAEIVDGMLVYDRHDLAVPVVYFLVRRS